MSAGGISAILAVNFGLILAVMLILWPIACRRRDVSFIDAAWPMVMVLAAVATWFMGDGNATRKALLVWLCAVWGLRLGWHLYTRWKQNGPDHRYQFVDKMEQQHRWAWSRAALLLVFLPQAFLAWLVSLPVQLGQMGLDTPVGWLGWTGAALAVIGIAFESIGDALLKAFKADPANRGKVLDTGLWRYTRHPNYFGDFAAWWGIWLACAAAGWGYAAATVIGPLFLSFTLTKWSGVTLLEKGLDKTKGDKYAEYKRRTSAFFPLPPKA